MANRQLNRSVQLKVDDFDAPLGATKDVERIDARVDETFKTETVWHEPYVMRPALVEAVNIAIALGRPLLLQGEPGCGKTQLAHAVAYALGLPLEQAYIKSTSRAQDLLYTFDAVRELYDAQRKDALRPREEYVQFGPLGRALRRAAFKRRSVVLLDEIDKADIDFPNDLLYELDRLTFHVAEAPNLDVKPPSAELRPIVFVTHNEEKPLPTAFLRRCVFLYIDFPDSRDELMQIVKAHGLAESSDTVADAAIDVVLRLRKRVLEKKPGPSELLDWLKWLEATKTRAEDVGTLLPYSEAIIKSGADRAVVEEERQRFKAPAAASGKTPSAS